MSGSATSAWTSTVGPDLPHMRDLVAGAPLCMPGKAAVCVLMGGTSKDNGISSDDSATTVILQVDAGENKWTSITGSCMEIRRLNPCATTLAGGGSSSLEE